MRSKKWLDRNKKDFFVKEAKEKGYLSRAAFKLIEINKKFKFIENSKNILELGSSPGGWSQVIFEVNPKVKSYGFDLLEMKYSNEKFIFIKDDFLKYNYKNFINKFDLILSDIAPNTTGHKSTDHLRLASIIEDIISIIKNISSINSNFVFKIWKGSEEKKIIDQLKKIYSEVLYFKPSSSRSESSEIYIVAKKFIG